MHGLALTGILIQVNKEYCGFENKSKSSDIGAFQFLSPCGRAKRKKNVSLHIRFICG